MKFRKRIFSGLIICLIIISVISVSASAYAYDNDIGYSFIVKANGASSYSSNSEYRGATTTATPWKVNLTYSAEGTGTYMRFFLAKSGILSTQASDHHDVKQGSGAKYYRAYEIANQTTVKLGAKNNNLVSNTYTISGYWDEETAYHPFSE